MLCAVTMIVKVTEAELGFRTLSVAEMANVLGPSGRAVRRLMLIPLVIGLPPTVPLPSMVGATVFTPDPRSVTE